MNADRILVTAFVVSLGVEMYRGWAKTSGTALPAPSLFVGVAIVFTVLSVLATFAAPVAAALGVAFLIALITLGRNPIAPNLGAISTTSTSGGAPNQSTTGGTTGLGNRSSGNQLQGG